MSEMCDAFTAQTLAAKALAVKRGGYAELECGYVRTALVPSDMWESLVGRLRSDGAYVRVWRVDVRHESHVAVTAKIAEIAVEFVRGMAMQSGFDKTSR